jgi:hypothetical protein
MIMAEIEITGNQKAEKQSGLNWKKENFDERVYDGGKTGRKD